ncbi:MAG: penicillin-binding protein 1C [Chitinophagales bacterium]
MSKSKIKLLHLSFIGVSALFILLIVTDLIFPFNIHISYSKIITASDGSVLHAFLSSDEKWRMKTELNEITPLLKRTIIEKEDKYFYYHPGINPVAVARALINNVTHGKKTSGASTLTMQVARMVDRKPRTYSNKLVEMLRAFQLELHYSKDEILQLYLNLVPYGGNIEGVKSAALMYFGQAPDYLSLAQVVSLAIIPNRPSSLIPGKNNDVIVMERNKWLKKFEAAKLFPADAIQDALGEEFTARRREVPRLAPHISIRLAKSFPMDAVIHSTIDRNKQEKAENLAFNYIRRIHYKNITSCAVMVLNNESGNVEAYIGSSDFNNYEDKGQVDGVTAIRSPGSTLKPFLYAIAFDRGMVTPKSVITDVPANYAGYIPENFDKRFHGSVTVEHALANSLNVPAVKMLDAMGAGQFITALKNAGFSSVRKNEDKLGLSVVLGGCGVKLEELVVLYSCFANEGRAKKISFIHPGIARKKESRHISSLLSSVSRDPVRLDYIREDSFSQKLISPAAAYITADILTRHARPDLPNNYESSLHSPKIAWKTGTSYGRRDAWSIGFNKHYTIGVWVGNFDGRGVSELTGADIATPLLFDIFNSLDYNSSGEWLRQPLDCDFRLVCSVSGKVPDEFCTDQVMDYFIPEISSTATCSHLKEIFVNSGEDISYCRNCLPPNGYKITQYPNFVPELISFYESENIPYLKIPEHNHECTRIYSVNAPVITSPAEGLEYIFEKDGGSQLLLACNAHNEVKEVYWYVNDIFYRSAGCHDKIFITPGAGVVKVSCADDKGRNSDVKVKVTLLQ